MGQIARLFFPDGQSQPIVSDEGDPGMIYAEFLCWRWGRDFLGRHRRLNSTHQLSRMIEDTEDRKGDTVWPFFLNIALRTLAAN